MSVFSWSRRPSAPDAGSVSPRPRTTSGGGLAALAGSMLSLSKAKSRERLRTKTSSNRQTVVSTESESSVWPEPTTPSSGSDKRSFQGMVGVVGDDPFARPPVFIKESPVPSLAAFPDPPPPRTASGSLHPPSRASSPSRSRSTSASSSVNAKSPRTPPPLITSVSDMHAHADAFSWTESIYDDRPIDAVSSLPAPRLVHSASASHLSASLAPSCHSGRAGSSAVGMGSMTALASGIVQRLEDGEPRKRPPKRPSRSELRDPPTRKSSLLALNTESTSARSPERRALESSRFDPTRSPDSLRPLDLDSPVSPRPRTASSPGRLRPTPASPARARLPSPRLPASPTSPSPRLLPTSPSLFSPTFPTRLSEDSEDLDNYHFTIAPRIQESDAHSISFSELGIQLADDDVWSDDGVTFHHGPSDSLHHVSADSPRYGARRPPPSPTSLPFMAGNARRRINHDMVYPSGVHTIPMADKRALAKLGKDEVGKEEDAVVGIELATPAAIEEEQDRASTSSGSSLTPDAVPPQTISSHIAFSKHARTSSYSDSELDFEISSRVKPRSIPSSQTQTAVAWRCGAGNHEKCCGTRAMQSAHAGQYKCCAERTVAGKHARCCASYIGRPCERPRVSSTSSAELKRQRSLHFASAKGFFHRPHTSHGKSTSSALLDDETRAMIQSQAKAREDPGPQSPTLDTSPPTSPAPSRHEFKAKPIISPAKLHDHLKQDLSSLEPARARRNTDTESLASSARSVFSTQSQSQSEDAPAPMRSLLPPRPRRNQVSLPVMKTNQVEQPRRYVQSITGVVQSAGLTRPGPAPFGPIASGSSLSSIVSGPGPLRSSSFPPPPPHPRRDQIGRVNTKPIVSFISSRSASTPTPALTGSEPTSTLRHCSSRESYESGRTVRRERSIPLREAQMSFLEFGVDEEEEEEEESSDEDDIPRSGFRPPLHHSSSFLDLDLSRLSGDTMRETDAMFSHS
ncbi:unnamed protein product [Rhizoctonia solani]|uniref:Uncharacterized protein n=1 Tax=Rhizoctonia solani TaxID=456999 RepID=A0A8H3BC51_9AGAM|nr:unnamed protein product [Rhizoctonia solani]